MSGVSQRTGGRSKVLIAGCRNSESGRTCHRGTVSRETWRRGTRQEKRRPRGSRGFVNSGGQLKAAGFAKKARPPAVFPPCTNEQVAPGGSKEPGDAGDEPFIKDSLQTRPIRWVQGGSPVVRRESVVGKEGSVFFLSPSLNGFVSTQAITRRCSASWCLGGVRLRARRPLRWRHVLSLLFGDL